MAEEIPPLDPDQIQANERNQQDVGEKLAVRRIIPQRKKGPAKQADKITTNRQNLLIAGPKRRRFVARRISSCGARSSPLLSGSVC